MTKKDYELIAESIRKSGEYFASVYQNDEPRNILTGVALGNVVMGLCQALKEANSRFDGVVFRKACGLEN